MHILDCIECPKCRKPFLKKVGKPTIGKEYYCHNEHIYFGTWELVTQWGLDAGDFYQPRLLVHGTPPYKIPVPIDLDTAPNSGEPIWANEKERDEAYEVVHRMFLGIPEWNDYQDLKETQECALDRGIQ